MRRTRIGLSLLTGLLMWLWLSACRSENWVPRPRGYPRIDLPEPAYQPLNARYPYFFEYSRYAQAFDDTFNLYEPDWIHVYYPTFDANIQVTYKHVDDDPKKFEELVNDALRLAVKHNVKAYAIEEMVTRTREGRDVVLIELQGDVPSYFQFYMTDTTTHFLRAALYFPTATRADSLSPVIAYIKEDMMHMVNTLYWKDRKAARSQPRR